MVSRGLTLPSGEPAKRVVIKLGSAQIADGGAVRTERLSAVARDIAALKDAGADVLLVSSGAIALGRARLGLKAPTLRLEEKQAAAAIGQIALMQAWSAAFEPHGAPVAQALLTLDDTERRRRWLNARATLQTLIETGAVSIINENDTVATEEIRYGDNDRLAARVAQMVAADALILLTDVDGLYTADPRKDRTAKHIPRVEDITEAVTAMAGGSNRDSGVGSGGMKTKIDAARIAVRAGCACAVTLGGRDAPILSLNAGARATWFTPSVSPDTARRQWLGSHLKAQGAFIVDAGAARALASGASLLPVGLSRVDGAFDRGDAVTVKAISGALIGTGVSAYSSDDAKRIAGKKSREVEAVLGFQGRPALIHRDDFVHAETFNVQTATT